MATATATPSTQSAPMHLAEVRDALLKLRDGDFSSRLSADLPQYSGMVARTYNSLAELMEQFASEHLRITYEVGTAGDLGGQAEIFGIAGQWRQMHDSLNKMGAHLTEEVRVTNKFLSKLLAGESPAPLKPNKISGEFAQLQLQLNQLAQRLSTTKAP